MDPTQMLEGLIAINARQKADMIVIGALIASHQNPRGFLEAWRTVSSEMLPGEHLDSLRSGQPELSRKAFAARLAFWREFIQANASGPEASGQ